jgi:hypothetical protein
LGAESFFVYIYYIAFKKKEGKFPSQSKTVKELSLTTSKVQNALSKLFVISNRTPYKETNLYFSALEIYEEVGKKLEISKEKRKERNKKAMDKFEGIWKNKILPHIPDKYLNERNTQYFYKIQSGILNLFRYGIKENDIPIFVDWFVKIKLPKLDGFNYGILTCNPMIEEFINKGANYLLSNSKKRIEDKRGKFESDASGEEKKLLESLKKKIESGEKLDEFDKELVTHFQEKNLM